MIETTFRLTKDGVPYINTVLYENVFNTLQGDAAAVFFSLFGNEERPIGIGMRVETLYERSYGGDKVITESEWNALSQEERQDYQKTVSMIFYPSVPGAIETERVGDIQGSVELNEERPSPQPTAGEFPGQTKHPAKQPDDVPMVDMTGLNATMNLDKRNAGEPQSFTSPSNFLESIGKK